MRKLCAVLVLLLLPLAACGDDSTGPEASITGTYQLQTVNGSSLPFVIAQVGTSRLEVTEGSLRLNADDTFEDRVSIRTTEAGTVVRTEVTTTLGRYQHTGSRIVLTDSEGVTYDGMVQDDVLTISFQGVTAVYRK